MLFENLENRAEQAKENLRRPLRKKGLLRLAWPCGLSALFSLLFVSCANIQHERIAAPLSPVETARADNAPRKSKTNETTGSPNNASYYHAMLGLQYEQDRAFAPTAENDRLALNEYLTALEYDPKALFLLKKIAMLHNRLGNPTDALFYAEKASTLYPTHAEALILLGDLHIASGDTEKGLQLYQRTLEIEPETRDAYFKIAGIYADRKDLKSAEAMLHKGIEAGPPSALAYFYLGRLRMETGNLSEGLHYFEETLALDPYFEPAHLAIAAIFERQNQWQAAIDVYRNIINRINPRNHQAVNRVVQLLIRKKAFDEAIGLLDGLSEDDPDNLDIALQKTLVYVEQQNLARAIQTLTPVVEAKKEDARLHIYLATLYEENDEIERAVAAYRSVLERHPEEYDAHIRLGYLYFYRLKNVEDALIQGRHAKRIDPKRIESYLFTGLVLHDAKRYEDAVEIFLEGIEKKPLLPDLYFHLGATFDKMNRFEDMIRQMKKAIDLDANHANALNYLGYTYADKGIHLDTAVDLINRALAVRPNDGYFIDSLAWAYYKQGRIEDAIDLLQKAVSSVPDDPIIHEHLGEVYLKNNHGELAKKAWERSLELNPENEQLILRYKRAGFGTPHLKGALQKINAGPSAQAQEGLLH